MLGVEVYSSKLFSNLIFLNIYGPCHGHIPLWNIFFSKPLLNFSNLVLGGDLNVSLGLSEFWGPNAQVDPLIDFFLNKIWLERFIDVDLLKEKPTQICKRVGEERVEK